MFLVLASGLACFKVSTVELGSQGSDIGSLFKVASMNLNST